MPGGERPAPPAAVAVPRRGLLARISWLGLAGGLAGGLPLAAVGIELLIDPPEAGRWLAAVFLTPAAAYLIAAGASVVDTPRRRAIQRWVVGLAIVLAVGGSGLSGISFAGLLLIPTLLLAVASGLVFSRSV